jgi:hypothetical protein
MLSWEKAKSISYSECVSAALVIQHAKRMRRIILSSAACPALLYISTMSHIRHDFRGKVFEYKVCVLIFCTNLSETFLTLKRNNRDIIINVHVSACKVPDILVTF